METEDHVGCIQHPKFLVSSRRMLRRRFSGLSFKRFHGARRYSEQLETDPETELQAGTESEPEIGTSHMTSRQCKSDSETDIASHSNPPPEIREPSVEESEETDYFDISSVPFAPRSESPCMKLTPTNHSPSANGYNMGRRVSFTSEALFFEAVTVGNVPKVAAIIEEKSIDVNELRSYCGRMALHLSAAQGDVTMSEFLVKLGADVNATDENADTPLHRACDVSKVGSHIDLVRFLVSKGAYLNQVNSSNELPYDCAKYDYTLRSYLLEEMKRRELDPEEIRDAERRQLMAWAKEWRQVGASPHAFIDEEHGVTLAHYVAARHYSDVFKVLLKCPGVDMTATDWQGKTPLQLWSEKKRGSIDYADACTLL